MRTFPWFSLLLFLLAAPLARAQDALRVNWPSYMARHDLTWNTVPRDWGEGAFQGNGELGANIFAGPGNTLDWRIGRTDVVYEINRIPIGDFLLHPVGRIKACAMRLNLWDAEVTGTLTTDAGEIVFRSLTHANQMAQLIEIMPSGRETGATFDWQPGLAADTRAVFNKTPIPADKMNPAPERGSDREIQLSTQPLRTGGGHVTAWKHVTQPDHHSCIYLAVGYSTQDIAGARAEAESDVTQAAAASFPALLASHREWWHQYYPESFLSIPDTRLESFYWIQMYKLASATRADRPAIDLMGPWFNPTPWPRIWWNLNIQLTYWPVLASNRLELGESLCRLLDRGAANLSKNAGPYSADSMTIGRASVYDCRAPAGDELCNLPWVLHNYYLQYRYSMDEAMLRDRLLPLLKPAINYYLHLLVKGPDGKLHIPRGLSPEYPNQPKPNPDCNIDLALLRWGCQTLIAANERLHIDDPLIPTWKNVLANLTPYPVDKNGLMISASVPFAVSHRHFSHLLMVFPLYIMNLDQPENRDLVIKSLSHWMGMPQALQGYSYTGAASISALLGRGDDAAGYLNKLLDKKIHPNTLYSETGPVIETPLSAAASVHDMLLSSWGDKIRVFPGVPHAWRDVSFYHLRTEGAFLVSAVRRNGATQFVTIESLAGAPCRVWTDMENPVANPAIPARNLGGGVVELDLKKGEAVTLYPANTKPDLAVGPVPEQPNRRNFWGVHAK